MLILLITVLELSFEFQIWLFIFDIINYIYIVYILINRFVLYFLILNIIYLYLKIKLIKKLSM